MEVLLALLIIFIRLASDRGAEILAAEEVREKRERERKKNNGTE